MRKRIVLCFFPWSFHFCLSEMKMSETHSRSERDLLPKVEFRIGYSRIFQKRLEVLQDGESTVAAPYPHSKRFFLVSSQNLLSCTFISMFSPSKQLWAWVRRATLSWWSVCRGEGRLPAVLLKALPLQAQSPSSLSLSARHSFSSSGRLPPECQGVELLPWIWWLHSQRCSLGCCWCICAGC